MLWMALVLKLTAAEAAGVILVVVAHSAMLYPRSGDQAPPSFAQQKKSFAVEASSRTSSPVPCSSTCSDWHEESRVASQPP